MKDSLHLLATTPWAIAPEFLPAIADVMEFRVSGVPLSAEDARARIGTSGNGALPEAAGGIAVIPIRGVISPDADEYFGGVKPDAIATALDRAMAMGNVSTIVLAIDSPGGSVYGIPELAERIAAAAKEKHVVSVATGMMASAAYWIGSAASESITTPSGQVGSIGVFTMHADLSRMLENAGIEVTLIKAGKYKAEGNPFGPLSDDARDAAQARIDDYYDAFVTAVARHRGVTSAAVRTGFGEGRVENARAALKAGLVDRVASLETVLGELAGKAGKRYGTGVRATADPPPQSTLTIDPEAAPMGGLLVSGALAPSTQTTAAGGSAVVLSLMPSVTAPAPKAKENTVSDPTAAQNGADAAASFEALMALAETHGKTIADVRQWTKDGLSVDQVRAALLDEYKKGARALAVPGISVGETREAKAPFATAGEFYGAVYQAAIPGNANNIDIRLKPLAAATGMNQGVGSEGGFTVPPQYSNSVWDGLNDPQESLLPRTDSYTVQGESLTFNANAETSRATGSRYGGVQAYWIAEADQIPNSKPKFRQMKLEPHGIAALVYVTDKLLKNSNVALEQYVNRAATEEINFLVGDAIVNGPGGGKPKGLVESGCKIEVAKETSQAADTINQKNINKMWARLHPRARANAVWLHNVDIEPQLDELSTTVMNVAATENVGGYANKVFDPERRTLKGRPLVACEFCPTLGDAGDLILTDLKYYATGVQGGVDTAVSMHLRFDYAETAFRFMFAVDGQSWLASALTPFKGSNTLSSVVTLAARA